MNKEDMEEVTYTSLRVLKTMNKKIICNGKDITEKIEELQDD